MTPLFPLLLFLLLSASAYAQLGGVNWSELTWTLADQLRLLFAIAFWASAGGLLLYGVVSLIGPTKHARLAALHDAIEHVKEVLLAVFAVTAAAAGGIALMPQVASVFVQKPGTLDSSGKVVNYLLVEPIVKTAKAVVNVTAPPPRDVNLSQSLWGLGVFTAMAAYAGVLWLTGVRRFREEASDVLLRAVVGLVLYTVALLIGIAAVAVADEYVKYAKITRNCFTNTSAVLGADVFSAPAAYQQWLVKASGCATKVYDAYFKATKDSAVDLLSGVAVVGIFPIAQQFAFSFMQVLMYLLTAAMSLASTAASAFVSITSAASLAGISVMALAAVAVMHERTRLLGAIVLGALAAAPALIVAADAAYGRVTPDSLRITGWQNIFAAWSWGDVVNKSFDAMVVAAMLVLALALYGLIAYAVSRIFDHVGGALAGE
ncbi:MAG: hypothetical protein QW247_11560 [Pyrobaculum sp.]|uniref:hypothetical protein n=1 Tax=Pyrobaculum sp. TaxID=2004705 RepID=UPI003164B31B